ncbi:MAG TPA: hypothetical protein VGJ84_07595 [Polyangiaceae bacterium]|jgi:hypothetical protein
MRNFTLVRTTETGAGSEKDLALLRARVLLEEPSAPGEYVGLSEGALLDEDGRAVAFLVRLSERLVGKGPQRTLIPRTAVSIDDASTLHVRWTEDQLLAQPRIDEQFGLHRVDEGQVRDRGWIRPNVVPPGKGPDASWMVTDTLAGAAIGAGIGAVAGLAIAGPIGLASLGVFFAAGGGLAGLLAGASYDNAAEASELREERNPLSERKPESHLDAFEEAVRDPSVAGRLETTRVQIAQGPSIVRVPA